MVLNRVAGASKKLGGLLVTDRAASCWVTVCATTRATRYGVITVRLNNAPRARRSIPGSSASAVSGGSAGGRGSGLASSMISLSPTPETPSITA